MTGELSGDPNMPGAMKEHAKGSPLRLKPNVAFHALRDGSNKITHVYTYACLVPGVFSFTLLGREARFSSDEIQNMVDEVDEITKNILDLKKMKITDTDGWKTCGVDI